ncbi:MAG: DUF302 domain-containing protein [Thiocapsa sp.]|nr:DUF302 domain-containing protein [Thiocapsa sp.]MCG6897958.1 DUF302 domain-containing protein [Thiocapsa sp.]MCG6985983.1 DUF302 domain-containing protein [Thiocapsa sp.]
MLKRGFLGLALLAVAAAAPALDGEGMVITTSRHSVPETADRAAAAIAEHGLGVFARIDHAEGALKAGLDLAPTELLIFGNPTAGTRLMHCGATVAIDLPLKLLVWRGPEGITQVAYNDPAWLSDRHGLEECAAVLANVEKALSEIAAAAGD